MTDAFLIVEKDSVRTRVGGPAIAKIRMVIDGCEFPAPGWSDFVVVILGWWVAAVLRLMLNTSTQERVNFMDGPYAVDVSKPTFGKLHFRALEGSERHFERAIGEVATMPFALRLISQSREVLDECKRQDWWSIDADVLVSSLMALEKEVLDTSLQSTRLGS